MSAAHSHARDLLLRLSAIKPKGPDDIQHLLIRSFETAIAEERERCASLADAERERHMRGSPVSSTAEDFHGAATAKEIADAIRDERVLQP